MEEQKEEQKYIFCYFDYTADVVDSLEQGVEISRNHEGTFSIYKAVKSEYGSYSEGEYIERPDWIKEENKKIFEQNLTHRR